MWEIKILGKDTGKNGGAAWMEDGLPSGFDLLPGLLRSPKAKQGKNGLYVIVPFKQNQKSSKMTNTQSSINQFVRQGLKDRNIPYGKIESNPDGSPKMGLIHRLNLEKPKNLQELGVKSINDPAKVPLLQGLSVYQKASKNEITGKTSTRKEMTTFRVASASHSGTKWQLTKAIPPTNFLEDAKNWAEKELEEKIIPELLKSLQ